MDEIRWGLIGPGKIAHQIVKDFALSNITFSAVASKSPDRAKAFASEHDIPKVHASYEDLVSDPQIDAIYIATVMSEHFPNALLALSHGKHVMIEKSFTLNANQAKQLVELAKSKNLLLMEAMWSRFLPHYEKLLEVVASKELGEVISVSSDHSLNIPPSRALRLHDPNLGGGALLDLGVYPISFSYFILGNPVEIKAVGVVKDGVDHSIAASMIFASGAVATITSSLLAEGGVTAEVVFTEGRVSIERKFYEQEKMIIKSSSGDVLEVFTPSAPGRGMQLQAEEFERVLRSGLRESSKMSNTATVEIMQIMDEIRDQIGLVFPGE